MHHHRDDIATSERLDEEHSAISQDWLDDSHDLVKRCVGSGPVAPYRDCSVLAHPDLRAMELQ